MIVYVLTIIITCPSDGFDYKTTHRDLARSRVEEVVTDFAELGHFDDCEVILSWRR